MNHVLLAVLSALALVLSGCGGGSSTPDPDPQPNELAGTYNGSITFESWFADMAFTIDNAGNLTGTTTVTDPSVGEKGTVTGIVKVASSISIEFDLVLESASIGRNTITGAGIYAETTRQLGSSSLTVKDTNGAFVDTAIIVATKE